MWNIVNENKFFRGTWSMKSYGQNNLFGIRGAATTPTIFSSSGWLELHVRDSPVVILLFNYYHYQIVLVMSVPRPLLHWRLLPNFVVVWMFHSMLVSPSRYSLPEVFCMTGFERCCPSSRLCLLPVRRGKCQFKPLQQHDQIFSM